MIEPSLVVEHRKSVEAAERRKSLVVERRKSMEAVVHRMLVEHIFAVKH